MYANTFEMIETDSSEDTDYESSEDEAEESLKTKNFLNMTTLEEYEKNRDQLFTKSRTNQVDLLGL